MDKLICSDRILRHPQYHTWKKRDLAKAIEDAPTIDPVHAAGCCYCSECKYSKYDEKFSTYSCCKPMGCIASMLVRPTDFCSYGERKEEK